MLHDKISSGVVGIVRDVLRETIIFFYSILLMEQTLIQKSHIGVLLRGKFDCILLLISGVFVQAYDSLASRAKFFLKKILRSIEVLGKRMSL